MPYEDIYKSAWQSPIAFLAAGALFLVLLARRLGFFHGFLVLFGVVIMADALLTGAWSPLGGAVPPLSYVPVLFVILGDLRYFLLVARYREEPPKGAKLVLWSVLPALVIPTATFALKSWVPVPFGTPRVMFLTYELAFFVLAVTLRAVVLPRALAARPPALRRFLLAVTSFQLVQYGGWAFADILILSGVGFGHIVRIVPNAMYYAAFLPYVWAMAPREVAQWDDSSPR